MQRSQKKLIIGIESSCDETAIGIVDTNGTIHSHLLHSQSHEAYGGVVPEVAARAHLDILPPLVQKALQGIDKSTIAAVAATTGPGLIGGLLVGSAYGKALAHSLTVPFIAVNHLEAHILAPRLQQNLPFPFLTLLVSGGHCIFVHALSLGQYRILGQTKDDALGEAFDKTARLLGGPYPGGAYIEEIAQKGNPHAFSLPLPLCATPTGNFSFSGLKTAVRLLVEKQRPLSQATRCDIAASFQHTICRIVATQCMPVLAQCPDVKHFSICGGVAANTQLRQTLSTLCTKHGILPVFPPVNLCTDNALMVAQVGRERFREHICDSDKPARPRWPIDTLTPP